MKTLVIIAHPDIEKSHVNKRWLDELKKYPDKYTIHDIYQSYPDHKIDVEKEQKLVESHGALVLQFPIYWFNCPPLLKTWLDDVLAYGWAYGTGGDNLKGRKVALSVTAGIKKEEYTAEGKYHYTLKQLLSPFETTFLYVKADYKSFIAFYGAEEEAFDDLIETSTVEYIEFLENL